MIVTEVVDHYIDDEEIRRLFSGDPVEVDDDLGLEVVKQETILSKYGITLEKGNSFHKSLQQFFDRTGFLTPKQLQALR